MRGGDRVRDLTGARWGDASGPVKAGALGERKATGYGERGGLTRVRLTQAAVMSLG